MDITSTLGYGVHRGYTRYILRCEKEKGLSGEGDIYIEVGGLYGISKLYIEAGRSRCKRATQQ